jgi:leader peptidase (prepilin peptidase)/N-methyltransferase
MTLLALAPRPRTRPGRRWPAVWASGSVILAVVAFSAVGITLATIPLLYLAVVTPELVRVDVREHRLPNRLVLPGIGLGLVAWLIESIVSLAGGGRIPLTPIVAGAVFALFLLGLSALGGMGMGDVKLAAALGLASWVPFVAVLSPVVGFLCGGVGSVIVIATRRRRREGSAAQRMAFGPYLLAGFWVAAALVAWARLS